MEAMKSRVRNLVTGVGGGRGGGECECFVLPSDIDLKYNIYKRADDDLYMT